MVKRILIANRGEIVRRIIRTCKKMGIETVAVYSDADKNEKYLNEADFSYYIGPSAPVKSYLNIDAIINAVKETGADALHPGYGFLSESAAFAKAVTKAGAVFIGPDTDILTRIESKCFCRQAAKKVGVPVTPGTINPVKSADEIIKVSKEVGLPILLKLDKGGGGKGINKIQSVDDRAFVESAFENIKAVGKMAFASEDVYVEKAVINPKHIEVQFVADNYGNVVCLGERECSIQRRYQKIIEESPSSVITDEERNILYDYTKLLVGEMKYTGAGTVEFLRGDDGSFFFMEINARLQVEHPVSEMVTGTDIVKLQIEIASGLKLSLKQEDIKLSGHAMECRIYAENPKTFMPCPGTIDRIIFPEEKEHEVRIEHALYEGYKVSPFYDPMLCKIIVRGEDRPDCINKMKKALSDFSINGVDTTVTANIAIMENEAFKSGNFTTAFLEKEKL